MNYSIIQLFHLPNTFCSLGNSSELARMAIEDFKHLIEAQSLEKKMKEHLDAIEEQINRVKHIETQRELATTSKEELDSYLRDKTDQLNKFEKELFDAEEKVKKTNEHIPLARNEQEANALQNELETLNPLIEKLQDEILQLMDENETTTSEVKVKEEFLEGSLNSLNLIKADSKVEVEKENSNISVLQERVDSLLDQANAVYKSAYQVSNDSHRYNNPLCFVDNSACHVCRYTLNQVQAQEIEKGTVTESCPGCGRLLTPLSAKTL